MRTEIKSVVKSIGPQQLLELQYFEQVKYQAHYLIESFEFDGAAEFAHDLEAVLRQVRPTIETNPRFKILVSWLYRLKLFALSSLPVPEQLAIFKEDAVSIISSGLDVKEAVLNALDYLSTGIIFEEFTKAYLNALVSNKTMLGEDSIKKAGVDFRPTVGGWIQEYQQVIGVQSMIAEKPGTFHIIKFVDNNNFVKYLTALERNVLKSILELYNWLMHPIILVDPATGAEFRQQATTSPYVSTQSLTLPQDVLKSAPVSEVQKFDQSLSNSFVPKAPPEIPRPDAPQKVAMEEVIAKPSPLNKFDQRGDSSDAFQRTKSTISNSFIPDFKKPLSGTLVNADTLVAQMKKKQQDKEAQIDKKLHDLENKVQRNK